MARQTAKQAAVGFRAHSGWAALVAVAGTPRSPEILDRRRIELIDPALPYSKQPYHAAAEIELAKARELVSRCMESAAVLALSAMRELIGELAGHGYEVTGCGLVAASGRALPELASILASHPLIHTAEGELFRNAIAAAAERCGLQVVKVAEKLVAEQAAAQLRMSAEQIESCLTAAGKQVGSPWTQDHKHAAVVAWIALASGRKLAAGSGQ